MTWQFRNLFKREKEGENILTKKIIINTCIYARSYNHIWNTHRILRMLISLSLSFFFFFATSWCMWKTESESEGC